MESGEGREGKEGRYEDADRIFGEDSRDVEPIFGDDDAFEMEPFAREGDARRSEAAAPQRRRRGPRGETVKRILYAIPWIIFAIAITALGGVVFTAAMIFLGFICLREFFGMASALDPLKPPAFLAVPAMIIAAHYGDSFQVLLVAVATFPLLFFFGANRDSREGVTVAMSTTVFGVVWIGLPLVHAVLLRDLPEHGGALLIDVLVGTFATDTAAYGTGRLFGSHKITPRLSPNKTLEGLIGGFVIGTMAFWFAGLYQDWFTGTDALIMGACVAAVAPIGDLFESMVKRDLGIKDTGNIFGPHGGLLDRLDAVLFTIVVGYYLAVAFVY
jgi:phosphatidate cytidylyltransferase